MPPKKKTKPGLSGAGEDTPEVSTTEESDGNSSDSASSVDSQMVSVSSVGNDGSRAI